MSPLAYLKLGGAVVAVALIIAYGEWRAATARQEAEIRVLKAYQQTIREMNDVEIPTDPDLVLAELCRLGGIDCSLLRRDGE